MSIGTLTLFAQRNRLKLKRDETDDLIIPGRIGHLYEYDGALIGLMLIDPNNGNPRLNNTLRSRTRKALREGLELRQQGDCESSFVFDAENRQHARLAVRLIGCKRKRRAKLSSNFIAARKRSQFKRRTVEEGRETPQKAPIASRVEELVEPVLVGAFRPSD